MIHSMKLQEKYFNLTKLQKKNIEVRLNDEKRKLLKKGDTIIFSKLTNSHETISVTIEELTTYTSFDELVKKNNSQNLGIDDISIEHFVSDLKNIYSKNDEKIYGVIAIKFHLLK